MLEEKNDNLLEADGSAATNLPEIIAQGLQSLGE